MELSFCMKSHEMHAVIVMGSHAILEGRQWKDPEKDYVLSMPSLADWKCKKNHLKVKLAICCTENGHTFIINICAHRMIDY